MFGPEQLPYTVAAAVLMATQPILVAMSKNGSGGFDYSIPASTMFSEVLKLLISAVMLLKQSATVLKIAPDDDEKRAPGLLGDRPVREFFTYMIPGLIYFVNNNLLFFILQVIDPTTFQVLSQMKTIFTGVLFRLVLGRYLTPIQWLALVTLACGTAVSQIPSNDKHRHVLMSGIMLSMGSSLLSALGGIYSEKLLKGRKSASLHWQNIQLYTWGVGFNAVGMLIKDGAQLRAQGVFGGFALSACAVVLCNSLNGLVISAVLKYADNIARVYAHAIAMLVTMAVCVRLFDAPMTPQLVVAVVLVASSTLQYNMPESWLHRRAAQLKRPRASEEDQKLMSSDTDEDKNSDPGRVANEHNPPV